MHDLRLFRCSTPNRSTRPRCCRCYGSGQRPLAERAAFLGRVGPLTAHASPEMGAGRCRPSAGARLRRVPLADRRVGRRRCRRPDGGAGRDGRVVPRGGTLSGGIHALFHPRPEMRRAAVARDGFPLPWSYKLHLIADDDCREAILSELEQQGASSAPVPLLFDLIRRADEPRSRPPAERAHAVECVAGVPPAAVAAPRRPVEPAHVRRPRPAAAGVRGRAGRPAGRAVEPVLGRRRRVLRHAAQRRPGRGQGVPAVAGACGWCADGALAAPSGRLDTAVVLWPWLIACRWLEGREARGGVLRGGGPVPALQGRRPGGAARRARVLREGVPDLHAMGRCCTPSTRPRIRR